MNDHREGIQAEKPIPPWERPGYFRLDCEPHRGNFLWWLGLAGFLVGALAFIPQCGLIPGLLGIALALPTRYMAKADLRKMQAGMMDPSGRTATAIAKDFSTAGLVYSGFGVVVWGGLFLIQWWIENGLWLR